MSEMIHGFRKTRETAVNELGAVLVQYVHEKTGLELAWLKRDEENKTFGIAFETLPENDTGVFHILEHSTLCGSDKYPVKEPFVALMKNSMNTFLNAMTYPDKTVYPVSSRNDKDFMNLVSVYLDAVFAPAIYHKPEIFRQEGWHYEFDEDGSACYNGVVFNEMKGAYSDPDELSETALLQALFPDTPYHFSSGGDPEKIPQLSYEQFLNTHRRFYSPSNAYVFLDGCVDLDAVLALIDDQYLSHMEKGTRIAPPPMQSAVKTPLVRAEYEVGSEEEEDGTARLVFGNVIGDYSEREKIVAMQILSDVLCGNNRAPLCKAVLESGLAEDVIMSVQGEMLQPYVRLELRNMRPENVDQAEKLVRSVLSEIVEKGIDKETLDAAMANASFRLQERDFGGEPQGLCFFLQVMESWLYGGAPEAALEVGALFTSLEEKAEKGYFETHLKDVLLDNAHSCEVLLLPSHTLGERRAEAAAQKMSAELENMSAEAIAARQAEQAALTEWQMSEDTPEALSTMPVLTLADVDAKPEDIPTEITQEGDIRIIRHTLGHNGVCYVSLYFDIDGHTEEEYAQLSLLCEVLGKLDTTRYTSEKLTNMVRRTFGSLDFSIMAFAGANETDTCRAKLCVSYSTLSENAEKALELVMHILRETRFDNKAAILDIVRQRRLDLYQEIMMSGSAAALRRLLAANAVSGVINECSGGIQYYQYLKTLDNSEGFDILKKCADDVFCRSGLTVSFTGDIPEMSLQAIASLPAGSCSGKQQIVKVWPKVNEGFVIPSDVAFAARGGNALTGDSHFSGVMALAAHIISLDYLWNEIRVQGGAYGTGLVARNTGFCGCYSYRDPSAAESLKTFGKAGEYLNEAMKAGADLTGAIIGTVSSASPLLTVRLKGQQADTFFFANTTYEDRCAQREALLNATPDELCKAAEWLDKALQEKSSICVIGSKEQIAACDLDKILSL